MATIEPGRITQVLLFFDEKSSLEHGPALWAAFHEMERFYRQAQPDLAFRRFYISSFIPSLGPIEAVWRGLGRLLSKNEPPDPPGDHERALPISEKEVTGSSTRTFDQNRLAAAVRERIGDQHDVHSSEPMLIVTDRPITPPPHWRYIIWEIVTDPVTKAQTGVVSAAPLDPAYWREHRPDRTAIVKHRVRAAGLGVIGNLLGLKECENPSCYMYSDVDSVLVLDDMTEFGSEHEVAALAGGGFSSGEREPAAIQSGARNPSRKAEGAP